MKTMIGKNWRRLVTLVILFYQAFIYCVEVRIAECFSNAFFIAELVYPENKTLYYMLFNLQTCQYKGDYCPKHQTIQLFWDVFRELAHEQKKQFLSEFSTIIMLDILNKNS